jgi:phosphatidylglycerol:prolipoprotein diacylglycerol transferase
MYSYGVMVALGFAVATLLIYRHAGRLDLNKDKIVDMLVLTLLCGIVGARLLYIALNLQYYIASPLEVFDLSKGGLVWYGGFVAGVVAATAYIKANRLDFWIVMDLIVPYVALAQVFGRIGCFLNGCCYGSILPHGCALGVTFPDSLAARYPTQIYSSLLLLGIYVVLRVWQELPHFKGEIFLAYCILYPLKRFAIEFLRGDNPKILLGMTISQVISLGVFLAALVVFTKKRLEWRRYLQSK